MSYVTKAEYQEAMGTADVPSDFETLATLADEYLDQVTRDFYQWHDLETDSVGYRARKFKRAVIRQIAYMASSGIKTREDAHEQASISGQSIGGTTVNRSVNASVDASTTSVISADALALLNDTGLLYRGVMHR